LKNDLSAYYSTLAAPPQRDFAFNEKDLFFAKFEV